MLWIGLTLLFIIIWREVRGKIQFSRVLALAYLPTSRGKGTRAAGENFGSVLGTVRVK